MQTVYREYIRARTFRTRKAILYSLGAGTLTLALGLNPIQMSLVCAVTWITTWGLSTPRVRRLQKIHWLGGKE